PMAADRLHLLRQLRQGCPLPLAVDEASVGPADFFAYAAEGLVDYLVVKVTRSGGIWPTLQQIGTAEAAGLPLLVSGLTDSLLTRVAVCQVALVYGFEGPAALTQRGMVRMFTNRLIRFAAVSTAVVLLAGCGSGASSYTPAGQSAQNQAPAATGAAAGGAKVHLVYFNARGAEAAERKLVE